MVGWRSGEGERGRAESARWVAMARLDAGDGALQLVDALLEALDLELLILRGGGISGVSRECISGVHLGVPGMHLGRASRNCISGVYLGCISADTCAARSTSIWLLSACTRVSTSASNVPSDTSNVFFFETTARSSVPARYSNLGCTGMWLRVCIRFRPS